MFQPGAIKIASQELAASPRRSACIDTWQMAVDEDGGIEARLGEVGVVEANAAKRRLRADSMLQAGLPQVGIKQSASMPTQVPPCGRLYVQRFKAYVMPGGELAFDFTKARLNPIATANDQSFDSRALKARFFHAGIKPDSIEKLPLAHRQSVAMASLAGQKAGLARIHRQRIEPASQ